MFGILARLLEILYSIWPSYGGSIILFTVVIMLVLAPLTFKSTRSMLAMQALQPEMKKLQNRYKDDRQKLNEEMMKFYQENKISPLGGCLPMIIQFPVFFILYAVLLGLTKRGPFGADLGHSVACSVGQGAQACTEVGNYVNAGFFHPAYLKHTSDLYQSLSTTRVMNSFGLDLSQSAWSEFAHGLVHALPYLIMVLIVMGLTYLQQQQIQSRQAKNADQNPTQQMMMKVMPIAMGFIYIIIPAGVVIYFLVSSLFRIGQQAMVTRTFYTGPNAIAIPATATEVSSGPVQDKSFWDRFKPSPDALPQVGKRAKSEGSGNAAASPKPKGSSSKGGQSGQKRKGSSQARSESARSSTAGKSANSKSTNGGKKKSRPTGSAPADGSKAKSAKQAKSKNSPTASKSKAKNGNRSPSPASRSTASGGESKAKRSESSRKAPSRQAPSRKAPRGPAGPDRDG